LAGSFLAGSGRSGSKSGKLSFIIENRCFDGGGDPIGILDEVFCASA